MIAIDKTSVSSAAPKGTVIGHLMAWDRGTRVHPQFTVWDSGLFGVSSTGALLTQWSSPVAPGVYSVQILSTLNGYSEDGWFEIRVAA